VTWLRSPISADIWRLINRRDETRRPAARRSKRRKAIASGARHAAATSLRSILSWDYYAAVIVGVPFIPGLHVNYSETKLPIRDGLLKLKDFRHGFGGSGIEVLE
jgi:hypothetical protein